MSRLSLTVSRLHLAGCTQSERLEALRIVKEGAAKRFANLVPGLSHVVVRMFSCLGVWGGRG